MTIPTTIIELRIGIMPVRTAVRMAPRAASHRVAPSASRPSTRSRWEDSSSPRRSRPSATPFIVFPSTMPSSGIEYCGAYQGSVPRIAQSAMPVTVHELSHSDSRPLSQMPG